MKNMHNSRFKTLLNFYFISIVNMGECLINKVDEKEVLCF